MKRIRRRKCLCCGDLYMPDRRSAYHQRHCPKEACRLASRKTSQRRWLAKTANRAYHCGALNVERVRVWRRAHPGYGHRKAPALQDDCPVQAVDHVLVTERLTIPDGADAVGCAPPSSLAQVPVGVGVAVHPTAASAAEAEPKAFPQEAALQDYCLSQHPLFVGLVAVLTDALQEDMVPVMARLQTRGQAILGKGPGFVAKGR